MPDEVKAQTYTVPMAVCFETLDSLLPEMGVTVQASDAQTGQIIGEYQSMAANGEADGPAMRLRAVCIPIYRNTTMVKLTTQNPNQPESAAPSIETKMVTILSTLSNRLNHTADRLTAVGTPARERADEEAREYARISVRHAIPHDEIQRNLMGRGYDEMAANRIVLTATYERANRKEDAQGVMMMGALLCIGGLFVTVGSYLFHVGIHIITSGAIVFGGIRFFKGLAQYLDS